MMPASGWPMVPVTEYTPPVLVPPPPLILKGRTWVSVCLAARDAVAPAFIRQSEQRLRRQSVLELATRAMTAEESDARATGEALTLAWPGVHEPELLRGDGCVVCPAFGSTCRGVEHEWWNEWEWEEFEDHLPSG